MIKFRCPKCKKAFSVKSEYAGKTATCPCGAKFRVPSESIPSKVSVSRGDTKSVEQISRPKLDVRDMKLRSPKKISNFLLYSYILFSLFATLVPYLPDTPMFQILRKSGGAVILVSVILPYVLLYKIWAIIQIGPARTTPSKAVAYLFIPLFGLYWFFQAFWGWAKDFNKILSQYDLKRHRMSEVLAGLASLTPFAVVAALYMRLSIEAGIKPHFSQPEIERDALALQAIYFLILIAYITCVNILFFWTARDSANFLADKFNSGDIGASQNRKLEVDCTECGRPLKGATAQMIGEIVVCPKCRVEFEIIKGSTPGMAVASLPLSFYPILNIVGLVCGFISLVKIKKSKGCLCGRRLALASTIIAPITILIFVTWLGVVGLTVKKPLTQQARVMNTKANLRLFHTAVNRFMMDNNRLPTEDEGLIALIEQPNDVEIWEQGGYLETTEIPKDGWGNDFIYELYPESGKLFVIRSMGPDGEEGAEDDLLSTDAY